MTREGEELNEKISVLSHLRDSGVHCQWSKRGNVVLESQC